jgi:hypothetical protein
MSTTIIVLLAAWLGLNVVFVVMRFYLTRESRSARQGRYHRISEARQLTLAILRSLFLRTSKRSSLDRACGIAVRLSLREERPQRWGRAGAFVAGLLC